MLEIEIKLKVDSLDEIREKLIGLGCIFGQTKIQKDRVYIPIERDFPVLFPADNALRIREQLKKGVTTFYFTLKQQTGNGLAKIEKESIIQDPIAMHEAILLMGYKEVSYTQKSRTTTKYQDMEICLDSVLGLGDFVEVEKITDGNYELIQSEMLGFLESLGCDIATRVTKGYDILMHEKLLSEKQ